MATDEGLPASQRLLVFWVLFFFLLTWAHPADPPRNPMASLSTTRRLFSSPPPSSQSMELHHRTPSAFQEFKASAHEVPSGPNPVSNRSCMTCSYVSLKETTIISKVIDLNSRRVEILIEGADPCDVIYFSLS